MTPQEIETAARTLFEADQTGQQTGLLSIANPDMTMDDAYLVQAALIKHHRAIGRRVIGWKIGLTSKAMQAALSIDIPDSGVLLDHMAFENGAHIAADRFIQPRIEAEVAFVMKSELNGPGVTAEQVLAATDYVAPSLEILDTRILRFDPESGRTRNICDTISDNAANGGIVLGDQQLDPNTQSTCAGWGPSFRAMEKLKKPASVPACSMIRPLALHGSPTGWRVTARG